MRIERLNLVNYRHFQEFDLHLHRSVNLVVGMNATGKTAVLDGLAVALGAWVGALPEGRSDRTIRPWDARLVRRDHEGQATADASFPVIVGATGLVDGDRPSTWVRELRYAEGRTTTAEAKHVRAAAERAAAAAIAQNTDLPLIAYYGTGRLWVQKRDVTGHDALLRTRFGGYAACLEIASNQSLVERWMAIREGARLQELARAAETGLPLDQVRAPQLEAVQAAALACLPGATRFYYSLNHGELRVEFGPQKLLPFSSLSDGQRSLVVLATDIAWRCVQLNPHLGKDAPALTKGVALVDEIELHLHPQWQRMVIGALTDAFPKLQWVFTTHSPQVVSTAKPEWLRVLRPDGTVGMVDHTLGRDSNALLRDVFDVPDRPQEVTDRATEIGGMLADGRIDEARAALAALLADLGPHDELVTGLQWELAELEQHPEVPGA